MKLLMLGDGILTTGFGTVNRRLAEEYVRRGWEVWWIPALDTAPLCDRERYRRLGIEARFPQSDVIGLGLLPETLDEFQPDVVSILADPGTAFQFQQVLIPRETPHVLYAPVEGAPVHPILGSAFRHATKAATMTDWGVARLWEEHRVQATAIPHGVDADAFRLLSATERADARELLGWRGKFVTAYVARNNGRKGHDRLIKALKHLPPHHLLYLHCSPWDGFSLNGWDLGHLVELWGLSDRVEFAPIKDGTRGTDALTLELRLAAADCYVAASKVEGFGLPLLEAMSCGLPVIAPADGGNQQEVVGDAAYAYLPVIDWDTWHTGAQLAAVSPGHIAEAILDCEREPGQQQAAGKRARERALLPQFRWEAMTAAVAGLVEAAAKTREAVPV